MEFKEQIKILIRLQEADAQIFDLSSEKDSLIPKIKEIDALLENKKISVHNTDEAFKRILLLRKEKETDLQTKEEKQRKYRTNLLQIKTNKEYTALQDEIDGLSADISLLEEEIIKLLDDVDEAKERIEREKRLFEEEKEKAEKEKFEIKELEKRLSAKIAAFENKRQETASAIDSGLIQQYEKILKNRGRTALAKITGIFCGECNMAINPQLINETRLRKNAVFCGYCGRILYDEN